MMDTSSLEQMQEDLSSYLRTLKLAMIDLINENYSDFINLSSSLVGLDKHINNLVGPLQIVKDDIDRIEKEYNELNMEIGNKLQHLKDVRAKKVQIESILKAFEISVIIEELLDSLDLTSNKEDIPLDSLIRIIFQMNEVNCYLKDITIETPFVMNQLKSKCNILNQRVDRMSEKYFLFMISNKRSYELEKLFEIYSMIGDLCILEKLLVSYFKPIYLNVISETKLELLGIEKFFQNILDIFENELTIFLELSTQSSQWFIDNIWQELVNIFTIQTPSLFASGNPDQFHTNYKYTLQFVEKFKTKLLPNIDISLLMKKFNTLVYFRIRFQEIASKFEHSLNEPYTYYPQEKNKFVISSLDVLMKSIKACWSENVYLSELFPHFWKLTLQLIARYAVWLKTIQLNQLIINNVTPSESTRLKCSLLSLIFLQTESTIADIRLFFKSILQFKPEYCDEEQLKDSLEEGLNLILETGLPNIVALTKDCLINKSLTSS